MFANTITLTVNSVAKVLNRVNQDNYGSEYRLQSSTESYNLKIRHSVDAPDKDGMTMRRHNVFVEHIVFPTPTTAMKKNTATVTFRSGQYQDPTEGSLLQAALGVWLAASTNLPDLASGAN